jgi:hypothetical protein
MATRRFQLAVAGVGAVTVLLLATDLWPGVRGPTGWQWQRRVIPLSPALLGSVVTFLVTALLASKIGRTWASASFRTRAWDTAQAVVLVFAQMVLLAAAEPDGLRNVSRRVMSPSFTSYHTVASRVQDPSRFLQRYPEIQRTFPIHGPSHPPGRVLFFWQVNRWVEPHAAFWHKVSRAIGGIPNGPPGTTDAQRAGAFVAGFLLMGIGALTVVPLVLIVGGRCGPRAVGAAVLGLATLPGFLLFTPQSDHGVVLTAAVAAAFAFEALRDSSRCRAVAFAFAGGLVASVGTFAAFTELAALGAWGLAFLGAVGFARRRGDPLPSARRWLVLSGATVLGLLVVPILTTAHGMSWPAVWRSTTSAAHWILTDVLRRDYGTWVVWNLWDFVLFLGLPLAFVCATRLRAEWRERDLEAPFATALVAALVVLDLSGKMRGETGRVWMFLTPIAVAGVSVGAQRLGERGVFVLAATQYAIVLALRQFVNVPG